MGSPRPLHPRRELLPRSLPVALRSPQVLGRARLGGGQDGLPSGGARGPATPPPQRLSCRIPGPGPSAMSRVSARRRPPAASPLPLLCLQGPWASWLLGTGHCFRVSGEQPSPLCHESEPSSSVGGWWASVGRDCLPQAPGAQGRREVRCSPYRAPTAKSDQTQMPTVPRGRRGLCADRRTGRRHRCEWDVAPVTDDNDADAAWDLPSSLQTLAPPPWSVPGGQACVEPGSEPLETPKQKGEPLGPGPASRRCPLKTWRLWLCKNTHYAAVNNKTRVFFEVPFY